jgi:hypothetical protein
MKTNNTLRKAGDSAEIRTQALPNMSPEHYRYTSLFGKLNSFSAEVEIQQH